jgi:Caspase domain
MRKALLVGINYLNDPLNSLRGCIDDVVNIANMLTTVYGYNTEDIVILRDDSTDPILQPTRENILSQLQSLAQMSENCEQIWIYYSGHGAFLNNSNRGILVPVDYEISGFIHDTDLFSILQQIQCPTFVGMDSCNSGTICDLEWNFEYMYGRNFMRSQFAHQTIEYPNIVMMSGCKSAQKSLEILDTKRDEYEGVFTEALLNVMEQNSYAITLGKLIQDICVFLVNKGIVSQKPMISSSSSTPVMNFVKV